MKHIDLTMKWSLPAVLLSIASPEITGFMVSNAHSTYNVLESATNANAIESNQSMIGSRSQGLLTRRNMASLETETDHDTVTVDLADGRDYPIYIGDNFDDEKGT